jgi:hypothetical protein
LGQDYLSLLAWERGLGDGFRRLSIAKGLEQAAKRNRRPFLDLIASLGRTHDSPAWWTSRVSERNTMVSPLFLHACHLRVGLDHLECAGGPLCIIAESWAVLHSLAHAARRAHRPIHWATPPTAGWRRKLGHASRMVIDAVRFLKRRTVASRVARRIKGATPPRPVPRDRPCAILRTFVGEGCLRDDGTFLDQHLPGLCRWLEDKGYNVWTIPVLHNMKRSYRATWDWMHGHGQRFLNPDEYYRVSDILFTLWSALQQALMPRGPVRLDGMDVTRLFEEERLRVAFDHNALRWILFTRLPYRLGQAGFRVDILIQGYENMIPEKGAILGFRRHMPETKIVAFQHPVPFPMLLCHFVPREEAAFAPLPDRIVCNGRLFREALIREGLPPERVTEGPALRFAHLWKNQEPSAAEHCPQVLVALPLELGAAVELFSKVLVAMPKVERLCVKVKPHPMMNLDDLLRACDIAELPEPFEFVEGPLAEWLARSRLVVSMGSAVLYEAAIAGVPTVAVGREGGLNLNPLEWLDGLDRVCHDPEEIRAEVLRLWRLSEGERVELRRRGKAILSASFNPVTEDTMHAFLDQPAQAGKRPTTQRDRRPESCLTKI